MYDLHRNSQFYTRVAEGEVANLLTHLNSNYVMDMINDNVNKRFVYNPVSKNINLVASFELYFKDVYQNYPSDRDNIDQARDETYNEVIDILCKSFNLSRIPNDDMDAYTAALNLYDVFVANFSENIISFFANYIYNNRLALYESMDLAQYKRDKESSILYFKRAYNELEIGILLSKIKEVVYYISGFDIDLNYFLSNTDTPKVVSDYITSIVYPNTDIFKEQFCVCANQPGILSEIRLCVQRILENKLAESGISKPSIGDLN